MRQGLSAGTEGSEEEEEGREEEGFGSRSPSPPAHRLREGGGEE